MLPVITKFLVHREVSLYESDHMFSFSLFLMQNTVCQHNFLQQFLLHTSDSPFPLSALSPPILFCSHVIRMLCVIHGMYLANSPLMDPNFSPTIHSAAVNNLVYTVSAVTTLVRKTQTCSRAVDTSGHSWNRTRILSVLLCDFTPEKH